MEVGELYSSRQLDKAEGEQIEALKARRETKKKGEKKGGKGKKNGNYQK